MILRKEVLFRIKEGVVLKTVATLEYIIKVSYLCAKLYAIYRHHDILENTP